GQAALAQLSHSNIGLPRVVRFRRILTAHLDNTRISPYVHDPAADFDDHFDYPRFMAKTNDNAGSVAGLEADGLGAAVTLRERECRRPKPRPVEPGRVAFGTGPREAAPPALPQGRSKRQVFAFRFTDAGPSALDAWLSNPRAAAPEPAIGWLDKQDSAHAG